MPDADAPRPSPETVVALDVATRHGRAVAHVHAVHAPVGVLVLGHGAGGGVGAPDLVGVTAAATAACWSVVLVEQPYRAAGKRVPPRADVLDEAWCDVVHHLEEEAVAGLRPRGLGGVPLVTGGRSSGARVACRTARATGSAAVLALAFPTRPPGAGDRPTRIPELEAAGVPVLVVQGATDPYGAPPPVPGRHVVVGAGDHGLKKDVPAVTRAVTDWLARLAP